MLNNIELAARFIFMAERFKNIHVLYEPKIEFNTGHVPCTENLCGTPTCHGGWALVALRPEAKSRKGLHYSDGARLLAQYLGFEGRHDLQHWADENPELWGNNEGYWMFNHDGHIAFNNNNHMSLLDVANWYLAVADRLLKTTKKRKGK